MWNLILTSVTHLTTHFDVWVGIVGTGNVLSPENSSKWSM